VRSGHVSSCKRGAQAAAAGQRRPPDPRRRRGPNWCNPTASPRLLACRPPRRAARPPRGESAAAPQPCHSRPRSRAVTCPLRAVSLRP
jgi:hypothetical protein